MFIKPEQSIKELHEMFMDIAVLVENQGEMVNRCKLPRPPADLTKPANPSELMRMWRAPWNTQPGPPMTPRRLLSTNRRRAGNFLLISELPLKKPTAFVLLLPLTINSTLRKKIMMLICVLISAPLGTWMALKYLGIL